MSVIIYFHFVKPFTTSTLRPGFEGVRGQWSHDYGLQGHE